MTADEKRAYEWAKNQNYQSVAARHAKTLAGVVEAQAAEIAELTRRTAEYQKFGEPDNVYGMLKYYAAEVKRLTAENDELVIKVVASQQRTRAAVECIAGISEALRFQRYSAAELRISEWRRPQEAGEEQNHDKCTGA